MADKKISIDFRIAGHINYLIGLLHKKYANREWSGIARVEKKQGYYLLSDIRFPKQDNSGAETEMVKGSLDTLLEDIISTEPQNMGEYKCRLHSHHHMGCFRSGTDEATKKSFNDGNLDFRWSVVTAYSGETINYKCALNIFKPVNVEFDINVSVEPFDYSQFIASKSSNSELLQKALKDLEIEKNIKIQAIKDEGKRQVEEVETQSVISDEDKQRLFEIFNVEENDENRAIVNELLQDGTLRKQQRIVEGINIAIGKVEKEFEDLEKETYKTFSCDYFNDKIKQLVDNIITRVPDYSGYTYPKSYGGYNTSYNGYNGKPIQQKVFDDYEDIEFEDEEEDNVDLELNNYFVDEMTGIMYDKKGNYFDEPAQMWKPISMMSKSYRKKVKNASKKRKNKQYMGDY